MEVHTSLQSLCASQEPGPGLQPLPIAQTLGHHTGTECDFHLTQSQDQSEERKSQLVEDHIGQKAEIEITIKQNPHPIRCTLAERSLTRKNAGHLGCFKFRGFFFYLNSLGIRLKSKYEII